MAREQGIEKVYVHCFLDGRDVPPTSGKHFVEQLQAKLQQLGVGQIATVMGRYYAMDRDKRWDRLQRAYDAMVCGQAPYEPDPRLRFKSPMTPASQMSSWSPWFAPRGPSSRTMIR